MEPSPTAPRAGLDLRRDAIAGAQAAAPLAVAVIGFAVSFGIVARAAGMGWWAPLAMSATTFAGSAQFAAASILQAHGTVVAACAAATVLNARYLPLGISVAPAFTGGRLRRLLAAQMVVDESWAIGHLGGGRYSQGRLLGAGLLLYAAWIAGTALGLLGAQVLGDPERLGLDVVAPAIFLALLIRQIRTRGGGGSGGGGAGAAGAGGAGTRRVGRRVPVGAVAAVLGAAIALILTPLTPPGTPLIAAVGAALTGLWAERGTT
jgi:4-azaleucine resistance transporter AzlC